MFLAYFSKQSHELMKWAESVRLLDKSKHRRIRSIADRIEISYRKRNKISLDTGIWGYRKAVNHHIWGRLNPILLRSDDVVF